MEGERDDAVGLALDEEERIIQRGDAHTVGLSVQPADPMLRGCGTRRPPDVHMGKAPVHLQTTCYHTCACTRFRIRCWPAARFTRWQCSPCFSLAKHQNTGEYACGAPILDSLRRSL